MRKEGRLLLILIFIFGISIILNGIFISAVSVEDCGTGTPGVFIYYEGSSQIDYCFDCGIDGDDVCPQWYGAECNDPTDYDNDDDCLGVACTTKDTLDSCDQTCGCNPAGCTCPSGCDVSGDVAYGETCQLIPEWCRTDEIATCGDYPTQAKCNANSCELIMDSSTVEGGENTAGCDIYLEGPVGCEWDATDGCREKFEVLDEDSCGNPVTTLNECIFNSEKTGSCGSGTESVKVAYSPVTGSNAKCTGFSSEVKCPGSIKLPFFGWMNFIISGFIIAGIYAFLIIRKKKEN